MKTKNISTKEFENELSKTSSLAHLSIEKQIQKCKNWFLIEYTSFNDFESVYFEMDSTILTK